MYADEQGGLATRIVAMVVDHVQACIRRDWLRVTHDVRLLSHATPSSNFRGRDPALSLEAFMNSWCKPSWRLQHLVRVQAFSGSQQPALDMCLSYRWPVLVPGL